MPPPQAMPASDTFGFCAASSERTTTTASTMSRLQVYEPPSLRYKGQIYHRAVSSPAATPSRPSTTLVARKMPITPLLVTRAQFDQMSPSSINRPQPLTITWLSARAVQSKKPFAELSPISPSGDARNLRERCVSSPSNGTLQEKRVSSVSDIGRSPSRPSATPLGASRSGNSTVVSVL